MKRFATVLVLAAVALAATAPGLGAAELERRSLKRAPVVVPREWPLHRQRRDVFVKPRAKVRVRIEPRFFPPVVIFPGIPFVPPPVYGRVRPHEDDRDHGYGRGRGYRERRRDYWRDEHYDYWEDRRDRLVWEDSETIYRDEDWVEFTLDCDARGERLWFEVRGGRVRMDWAEIVFDNGDAQVVDFNERSIGPGLYPLLDFRDGRRVDHVRMVARSVTSESRLILRMEK